jgi:alpha-tubulin suppressor-like RCC1 family protein
MEPIGSSVDVGWSDGKPRNVTDETKDFLNTHQSGVQESRISGRAPRPRSKNAPKPALTVNYQDVPRNEMDEIDLQSSSIEELLLKNAEAVKQFEYLEKSLVSFRDTVGTQASQLRQPASIVRQSNALLDLQEQDGKKDDMGGDTAIRADKKKGKVNEADIVTLQGAPPVFPDGMIGRTDAMNPLSNIYAEGDPEFEDKHLQPLDPIIVEGEGYLYGIRSVQIVALKESVRGNDFIAVYSGPNHSVGITAAGQVYSWGANDMRQLGYPGAEEGILGIDMDPRPVTAVAGLVVTSVGCGKHHTVVLTEEGQVYAWGAFGSGQLGVGELQKEKYPHGYVEPMKVNAFDSRAPRQVACGYNHTVIIDGMGDLFTCGTCDNGAHGQDSTYDVPTPQILQVVSGFDFRQVACGAAHSLALTASGQVWVWGQNSHGQLGLGDMINRMSPVIMETVQGKNIRKIACGEAHSAFLSDRDVYTFGDGSHGALGHGNSKSHLLPKVVIKLGEDCRLRDLDCGPQFAVALSDLGQMYYWGNMKSTSGRGSKHVFNMPRRFKGLEAIYGVACGEHEITSLVRIPVAPPLEHKFKAGIFVEEAESGVIEGYIGRACTWGRATDGKLGHGAGRLTQSNLKTPFAIYGPLYHYSVTVVACGQDHSCCITDNGRIFSWGSNKEGQLGLMDFKSRIQPTMIEKCCDPDVPRLKNTKNKTFKDIVVGNWHCLAITSKKKVYAWGKNKYGQLGLGHTNNMSTPTSILPLSDPLNPKNVRCIAAGKSHSAIVGGMFTCVCVCICMYVMNVCVFVCACIHAYIHTYFQKGRETHIRAHVYVAWPVTSHTAQSWEVSYSVCMHFLLHGFVHCMYTNSSKLIYHCLHLYISLIFI